MCDLISEYDNCGIIIGGDFNICQTHQIDKNGEVLKKHQSQSMKLRNGKMILTL